MSDTTRSSHAKREKTSARSSSPLWSQALERFRTDLERPDDFEIVNEVHSLDGLIRHVDALRPAISERRTLAALKGLGPKLKFVDDFGAVIALCFGANPTHTALLWGSIRLMLNYASTAGETLDKVLTMIEDLSIKLPRFKFYEDTLPLSRDFEAALVDVYTEFICFYARAIHFFRSNRTAILRNNAWDSFNTDFGRTLLRINRLSQSVETQAEMAQMRLSTEKYKEVLELMDQMSMNKKTVSETVRWHYLPALSTQHSRTRTAEFAYIKEMLNLEQESSTMLSVVLVGMGGVGKTRLALQYAHEFSDKYDVILWITAENSITLSQSFRDIAQGLKIANATDKESDAAAAVLRVKSWLHSTRSSWLLIFDNVDDISVVRSAWPGICNGRIIVTTRDQHIASELAAKSLHLRPLDEDDGAGFLLEFIELREAQEADIITARAISRALGGLPLALRQVGVFISHQRKPLSDFLSLYERHAARIHAKGMASIDYQHTLSTVWDVSLVKLSSDSMKFLNLLCFFEPDGIDIRIFIEGSAQKTIKDKFPFLEDEMDLEDVQEQLLQYSIVNKGVADQALSIHRLVQATAIERMTVHEKVVNLDSAVQLLTLGFPDTWSEDVGHQIGAWEKCEMCLPHIDHLIKVIKSYRIEPSDDQMYGELLLRSSWYLYEREMYDAARTFVEAALHTFVEQTTLAYASAVDLRGLIDLDLNHTGNAMISFQTALQIRQTTLRANEPLIAFSLNNVALALTEMNRLDEAHETHENAIAIRLRNNSDRIGNSYSNMASLLLRMDRPDEAEMMLKQCPSLQNFTDDTFLNTGNPRFSGDMVLLSRIRLRQVRLDEALRLASKALAFRQRVLGNRLKTCDSLYDVAILLHKQGKVAASTYVLGTTAEIFVDQADDQYSTLLLELITIATSLREGEGQLARASFKLSEIYAEKGNDEDSRSHKDQALAIYARLCDKPTSRELVEEDFMGLCPWMLW